LSFHDGFWCNEDILNSLNSISSKHWQRRRHGLNKYRRTTEEEDGTVLSWQIKNITFLGKGKCQTGAEGRYTVRVLRILNLGAMKEWMFRSRSGQLYPGKETEYPLHRTLEVFRASHYI
jgi:hypothetical protein